jgi:hypothetical protein
MGLLEDMLKALDRVEIWKELQTTPKRLTDLERRVAELEKKLGGKWPGDVCKSCGARELRLAHTFGPMDKGFMQEQWECSACNNVETRVIAPTRR